MRILKVVLMARCQTLFQKQFKNAHSTNLTSIDLSKSAFESLRAEDSSDASIWILLFELILQENTDWTKKHFLVRSFSLSDTLVTLSKWFQKILQHKFEFKETKQKVLFLFETF